MTNFAPIYLNDLQGFSVPAIIHNGGYYFVDLSVYENGRVECWQFEDFEHFKNDVQNGWVTSQIPNHQCISIHNLGEWKIKNVDWLFDNDSFIQHIVQQIKIINPNWQNIYHYTPKKVNGIIHGEDGRGTLYKEVMGEIEGQKDKINGQGFDLFLKQQEHYALVQVIVFKDSTIHIQRLENPLQLSLSEFENKVKNGDIATVLPKNARVYIYGLGSFITDEEIWSEEIENILAEIKEAIKEMNGEQTYFDICREMYQLYQQYPTTENKEKLKIAYENVPEHLRMYLGDMDTKDIVIRMIIYGEQEIENWSHYQITKALDLPLPSIDIVKEKE